MIKLLSDINEIIWDWPYIILLIGISIYITVKLKLPQLRIALSFKSLFKKNENRGITPFKALMTTLAGTLGTGNITGIATAIVVGGVGSLFWLFISGIFALAISYAENYIVLKHRKYTKSNGYFGGAMYVLEDVLDKKNLAVIFALFVIISAICSGSMTQANSLSVLLTSSANINKYVVGILLIFITTYIVCGGKYRLAKINAFVIPLCTLAYILLCTSVIYINRHNVVPGLKYILQSAFGIKQVIGGIVGISLSKIIGKGFAIGMFSNEAGMGSAPMFTATVDENNIEEQARIAATSVIIDTLILCMLTGITIVSTGAYNITDVGILLNTVFGSVYGGTIILNICMVFFVLSTIPCWEFYGEQAVKYIFKNNLAIYVFRLLYIIGIYIGSISVIGVVWDISGISNALMSLPNLYMIYKCIKEKYY